MIDCIVDTDLLVPIGVRPPYRPDAPPQALVFAAEVAFGDGRHAARRDRPRWCSCRRTSKCICRCFRRRWWTSSARFGTDSMSGGRADACAPVVVIARSRIQNINGPCSSDPLTISIHSTCTGMDAHGQHTVRSIEKKMPQNDLLPFKCADPSGDVGVYEPVHPPVWFVADGGFRCHRQCRLWQLARRAECGPVAGPRRRRGGTVDAGAAARYRGVRRWSGVPPTPNVRLRHPVHGQTARHRRAPATAPATEAIACSCRRRTRRTAPRAPTSSASPPTTTDPTRPGYCSRPVNGGFQPCHC